MVVFFNLCKLVQKSILAASFINTVALGFQLNQLNLFCFSHIIDLCTTQSIYIHVLLWKVIQKYIYIST